MHNSGSAVREDLGLDREGNLIGAKWWAPSPIPHLPLCVDITELPETGGRRLESGPGQDPQVVFGLRLHQTQCPQDSWGLPPTISLNGVPLLEVLGEEETEAPWKGLDRRDDPLTLFTWEDEGGRREKRSTEEEGSKVVLSGGRLSQSICSCVRFNWLHLTGERQQFIDTVDNPPSQCRSLGT